MDNIVVISQNLKLDSLRLLRDNLKGDSMLVVSTQFMFENEREKIDEILGRKCIYKNFSDLLSDADLDFCDTSAYDENIANMTTYFDKIKNIKNNCVIDKIEKIYPCNNKIIVCNDLGLDLDAWIKKGYKYLGLDYYYNEIIDKKKDKPKLSKHIYSFYLSSKYRLLSPIYQAKFNGRKYLFYGSMNRIAYRIAITFKPAPYYEHLYYMVMPIILKLFHWVPKSKTIRMTTIHENNKYPLPDHLNINRVLIQDGYLPPNYPSKYLLFEGKNVTFYTWDVLGQLIFNYHKISSLTMPFRKKLYMPLPVFPDKVKKVLCVASGAGDWTAVKNRSDEDKMIYAFGKVAKTFPDIEFIYRCHPVWVHPQHQGVNSIIRAAEYIQYLNLPNFKISCNIPAAKDSEGNFILSYKRSSFENDLKDVDIVFGEHSVSMIDAAFQNILFGSVNVTGRRDFFEGITNLGFPHCESIDEIVSLIKNLNSSEFKNSYKEAVKNYNSMTDKE